MAYSDLVIKQSIIKTTKVLSGSNVKVIMEGFAPRVAYDPKTKKPLEIVLPMIPDNCPADLLGAIQGYLDHESAHIIYSDGEDICDSTKDKTWHHMHNMVDDCHINGKITQDYPGTYPEILQGYQFIYDNLPGYSDDEINKVFAEDKKRGLVGYMSAWVAQKMGSPFQKAMYEASPLLGHYKELDDKLTPDILEKLENCDSSWKVRELTDVLYKFIEEQELKEEMEEQVKNQEAGSGDGEGDEEGEEGSSSGDPSDGTPKDGKSKVHGNPVPGSLEEGLKKAIGRNIEVEFNTNPKAFFWSDRMNQIISVEDLERKLPLNGHGLDRFDLECKQVSSFIRKKLERLLESRRRVYYVGGYKSGRLQGRSLYSVAAGNRNVFSKKNEIRSVNAAVGLLVDLSGSMNGPKVKLASQCAYTMADCLERLKVPFEALGFWTDAPFDSSTTRIKELQEAWKNFSKETDPKTLAHVVNATAPNSIITFKGFNEGFGLKSKSALQKAANSEIGMHNNEDATALRIALERLAVMPQEKKVLFVFSDGSPAFSEHHHINNTRAKVKELADNAMAEYKIHVVGIGICCDNVTKFYNNNHVISNLSELPDSIFNILSKQLLN